MEKKNNPNKSEHHNHKEESHNQVDHDHQRKEGNHNHEKEHNHNKENHHREHQHNHHDHSSCDDDCACNMSITDDLSHDLEEEKKKKVLKIRMGVLSVFLIIGIYLSLINQALASNLIFLVVAIGSGYEIIYKGLKSLRKGKITINFLVTIASIGAFLLSSGAEGAVVMFLFSIAEHMEDYAINKSKDSIRNLLKIAPDKATLKTSEGEREVEVHSLKVGDIVVVRPGEKVPIDGIIVKGESSINQSSITGESLSVYKKQGDDVFSSTINEEGYFELKVSKESENTLFAKIIQMVKDSEDKKADVDLFIDKFTQYYTPLIMVLALIIAILPPLFLNQSFETWIYRALVLLVISCPCALALSTPISMISAITSGAKKGVIIRGGKFVEELNRTQAIIFDKTGTLTEGKVKIIQIKALEDRNQSEIEKIVCSLEKLSSHPLSNAFKNYEKSKKIELLEVKSFKSMVGKGISGEINGERYLLGNKLLFNPEKIENNDFDLKHVEHVGKTIVFIGTYNELMGYVILGDEIRKEVSETIDFLKGKDIKTYMLTGDNEETAKPLSEKIGLDGYKANLLPQDKLKFIENYAKKNQHVAMIGDGVNDAPSLARANIGIAMGVTGTDVAIETADIVLMQDNLNTLKYLFKLARKTMNILKENIAISIIVKLSFAVLGVFGFIDLWEAVLIGDMGLTFLVIVNAIRISKIN